MTDIKWKAPRRVPKGCESLLVNPICHRYGKACSTPCQPSEPDGSVRLETDHIIPRSAGGPDAIYNCQLVCAAYNREKYNKPDAFYGSLCYFDREINTSALRPHQFHKGYNLVLRDYRRLFETPDVVLSRWLLLAWMVGAGKTVGMLAILFAINKVRLSVNPAARRIKKVLWLVHQQALVDSISVELKNELTKLGICDVKPTVEKVENSNHWNFTADIIVACPQAIWANNSNKLTEREIAAALGRFDAIIVDEGHFATDQYLYLSFLAPHAMKFCVTATPMNRDGVLFSEMGEDYHRSFALFSSFGYGDGLEIGIYKKLMALDDGIAAGVYLPLSEPGDSTVLETATGEIRVSEGEADTQNNFPRDLFIISEANRLAEAADSVTGYLNHAMVRVDTISRAKHLVKALADRLSIVGVWSGHGGKSLGDEHHPWMLAKPSKGRPKGQVRKNVRRVVVTVDIGQFGINNPYCSVIAWVEPNFSAIEIIQRIGRAIRSAEVEEDKVKLLWADDEEGRFSAALRAALDYMHNSDDRLKSFIRLEALDAGGIDISLPPAAARLAPETVSWMLEDFGNEIASGKPIEAAATSVVDHWRDANQAWLEQQDKDTAERQLDKVKAFARKLGDAEASEEVISRTLNLPQALSARSPALVMAQTPKKSYSTEEIYNEVLNGRVPGMPADPDPAVRRRHAEEAIASDFARRLVENQLRTAHAEFYDVESAIPYNPHDILVGGKSIKEKYGHDCQLVSYASSMTKRYRDLMSAPVFSRDKSQETQFVLWRRAILYAAGKYFNMKMARDVFQPIEKQLADALMRTDTETHIKAMALHHMITRIGELKGHAALMNYMGVTDGADSEAA